MPMVHCAACGQVRGSKEGYEKERRGEERRVPMHTSLYIRLATVRPWAYLPRSSDSAEC